MRDISRTECSRTCSALQWVHRLVTSYNSLLMDHRPRTASAEYDTDSSIYLLVACFQYIVCVQLCSASPALGRPACHPQSALRRKTDADGACELKGELFAFDTNKPSCIQLVTLYDSSCRVVFQLQDAWLTCGAAVNPRPASFSSSGQHPLKSFFFCSLAGAPGRWLQDGVKATVVSNSPVAIRSTSSSSSAIVGEDGSFRLSPCNVPFFHHHQHPPPPLAQCRSWTPDRYVCLARPSAGPDAGGLGGGGGGGWEVHMPGVTLCVGTGDDGAAGEAVMWFAAKGTVRSTVSAVGTGSQHRISVRTSASQPHLRTGGQRRRNSAAKSRQPPRLEGRDG